MSVAKYATNVTVNAADIVQKKFFGADNFSNAIVEATNMNTIDVNEI